MKKVFISLIMSGFLFTACSSDETLETSEEKAVGAIEATISFDQTNTKADPALSKAIPLTSWKNIESVQMFLYETGTGKIVYASDYLNPYNAGGTPVTKFTWTNIPVGTGTYDLALVANAKSSVAKNVSTYIGATAIQWGQYNVKDKLLNTDVFAKLKPGTLPVAHTSQSAAHAAQKGYIVPSEVFTAYATGIQIEEGVTKTLATALKLKREVSLLRVRINRAALPVNVKFDDDKASVLIQRQPQKLGFKQGTFAGGIVSGTANNINELIVGGVGATSFNTAVPSPDDYSNHTQMLTEGFTLWKDIIVFPNLPSAEVVNADTPVAGNRQYIIRVSALAPVGYVLDDNVTVLSVPTAVWWYGYIPHAFTANTIREINLTITSKGKITIPAVPDPEGGLIINLTAPEPWNTNIDRSDLEL